MEPDGLKYLTRRPRHATLSNANGSPALEKGDSQSERWVDTFVSENYSF